MEKFVLLAERRSGTSLLIDCLQNHDEIICDKRTFGLNKKIKNPDVNKHSGGYYLYKTSSIKNRLRHVFNRKKSIEGFMSDVVFSKNRERPIVGFRFIYNNVKAYPEVIEWCNKNKVKVVHLVRENILKTYISTITAKLHKMHHPREGEKIKFSRVELDIAVLLDELMRRFSDINSNREVFKTENYFELKYEDFVNNREETSRDLLSFLGAKNIEPLGSTLKKINPSDLKEIIINYEDVVKVLKGTQFESLLASKN